MSGLSWTRTPSCWVVTDGSKGMENQCLGLAEALGLQPTVKHLSIRAPWRRLPPKLWFRPLGAVGPAGDPLEPPWPDLMITCGKRSVAPAMAVRKASGGATFTVHIQDPQVHPKNFDLVIAPEHDRLTGDNVLVTKAAIHRVTQAQLSDAADRFAPALADLPRPIVTVLIGGSSSRIRLTPEIVRSLAGRLRALSRDHGAGLAITPSRRTGEANTAILRQELDRTAAVIWDGESENPYFGYLALADVIVATSDSVSMVSEACSTGKPVYILALEGHSRRIEAFHHTLREAGLTRPFDGRLESWTYRVPDDTAAAASAVHQGMQARRAA